MKTIHAIQTKPLDGLPLGTLREFDTSDFERLRSLGAVREATEDDIKSAPQHLNKMAPAPLNKDIGVRHDANGDTADVALLRKRFEEAFAEQTTLLTTARADAERLTGEVSTLTSVATQHSQEVAGLKELLSTATGEVERLKDEVSTLASAASQHGQEVARLEDLLAGKDAEIATLAAAAVPAPLKAEHHGGGKFNITQGERVLAQGLSKADADAFNAMSDEDKAAFVQPKPAKA